MKIHTGDTVVIITGKDKGKSGRVMRILKSKNRVVVEGINMRIRHIKKTAQQPGQRISYEAAIHASNVMIVDPKTKKPARIGFKMDGKKGKVRIAKGSGEVIVKAAKAAPAKGAKKADGEKKEKAAPKADAKPAKQPFWKRGGEGNPEAGDQKVTETKTGGAASMPSAHRSQGG